MNITGCAAAVTLGAPTITQETPGCDEQPQVIPLSNGKFVAIKKAPPIKNLVLQACGARGAIFPTYLNTLEKELHFVEGLEEVAGSSAGSIVSYLLASGVPTEEIENFLVEHKMSHLIRGSEKGGQRGRGLFDGFNAKKRFRDKASSQVKDYCTTNSDKVNACLTDYETRGIFFTTEINAFRARKATGFKEGVTFSDLAILHKIKPEKFKQLHVTGFDGTNNKTHYFDYQSAPDMFCHDAIRISFSIPLVFKPVKLNGNSYSDGGEGTCLPVEIFHNKEETLAMVFDVGGDVQTALYGKKKEPDSDIKAIAEKIHRVAKKMGILHHDKKPKRFYNVNSNNTVSHLKKIHEFVKKYIRRFSITNRIYNYMHVLEKEEEKIREMGAGHVAVVPQGNLGTISFWASEKTLDEIRKTSREAAKAFAAIKKDEAVYQEFDTREAAEAWVSA
jgi:predicted acylesterase/phospholipase RssA